MDRSTRLEPEALLAHAGWLRQLAASLVSDPGTADDVVQDTWLAALRHAPADDRPLEPWLARVARNFAFKRRRSERRRAEHELAADAPRELPTPEQTLERIALQRSVVEAVLAIDEPFRTAIVQRYFEGHSAAEIARTYGVPAGTVRWRLKRGLAELRERLDARFGTRASWSALLAPLARREVGAPPPEAIPAAASSKVLTGVLAMTTAHVVLVAAGLGVFAGVVWWGFDRRLDPQSTSVAATTESPARAGSPAEPTLERSEQPVAERLDRREGLALETNEPQLDKGSPADTAPTATVEARFIDEVGAPWEGVRLAARVEHGSRSGAGPPAFSGPDGRVRLQLVLPKQFNEDGPIPSQSLDLVASRDRCTTVLRNAVVRIGETTHLGDVVLGPAVQLAGFALTEQGHAVAGAMVGITAAELPPEEDGRLRRHGSPRFGVPSTACSADGSFVLAGVGRGTWRLWAHAPGHRYAWSEPLVVDADRDLAGLELVLTPLLATDRIAGRIVAPDGSPIHASLMSLVRHERHGTFARGEDVDESGRFAILVEHDGEIWDLTAHEGTGRYAITSVEGVRPGTLDLVLELREKTYLEVRVADEEDRAVERAGFLVGVGGSWSDPEAEATAPGRYRVPLPDASFELEVDARGYFGRELGPFDPAALAAVLEVSLRRAPFVRGRVVAEGRAVAGARVELRGDDPDALGTVDGFRCVMDSMGVEGTSDADGRFDLACDLEGAFWIRAAAGGFAPSAIGPIDPSRLAANQDFELELTAGGAIEGYVLLPDGADAEGVIVAVNHGDGAPRTLRAGPNGFFRFEGLASGSWQVLARERELDPRSRTYSSLDEAGPIEWSCEVAPHETTRHDLDLRPR